METKNSDEETIARKDSNKTTENTNDSSENDKMQPPDINCTDEENCEPPEMPSGDFMGKPDGDMGRREFMMQDFNNSDAILHPAAYLTIGGGSVIIGILISYAIFSKFFNLKPEKVFGVPTKITWFIIVSILIAAGLIALGYFVPIWTRG